MFDDNGKDKLKAVMTIEMSFLVPIIIFLFMGLVLSTFYYHDKNIINGAAYETAVTGSIKMRQKEGTSEAELIQFCRDRMGGKCFFLVSHYVDVSIDEEAVSVEISAWKGMFRLSVMKKAAITTPEKRIRNIRRLDITDGA